MPWKGKGFQVELDELELVLAPCLKKSNTPAGDETGSCSQDNPNLSSDHGVENFFGISHLTNFVEFQGAVLELLQTDGVDNQSCSPWKRGGFSGNFKLSIPWKNGSLDIRKLDAEVCLDPIELRLQPSTIKWFLLSWETFLHLPSHLLPGKNQSVKQWYLDHILYLTGCQISIENEKDGIQEELDLGASVDQFFECLDGMRSSQSALGSSGMWNWTCSVFSALTAASSLASGSFHIPSEDQHVQTNLKATLAGISILLSFQDDDQEDLYGQKSDQNTVDFGGSLSGCRVQRYFCCFAGRQVCPQEKRFEGTVKCIEVADYLYNKNDAMNLHLRDYSSDSNSGTVLIQNLQAEVQENLQGSISIPCARVILCFPFASGGDVGGHSSWNQFIAFDISSPLTLKEGKVLENSLTSNSCSWKRQAPRATDSLHLNVGNLEEDPVTGPSIAEIAKSLAAPESRRKFMVKGYEFASATAVKDLGDLNSRTREEIHFELCILLARSSLFCYS
ncbi:hypothetical protein NC653_012415 [Populus alba x Populus x berolinensis]|uniref:Autophagy-related protein 2 n=1 Tax=Populus alba x Populus x berolinensis TaxID=444605 RepID=A0AAD6R4U0_9ROSI|nr:hypothetical protein NC653_012415 [Populus alba x Populus x berolinensis]